MDTIKQRDERKIRKKDSNQKNNKMTLNLQPKSHKRNKHLCCPPCKIH